MELILVFLVFIIAIAVSLVLDINMMFPLALGFVLFAALSVKKGFALKEVLRMAAESVRESFIVIWVLLIIGCMTGLWRISGTVAYFVSAGINLMPKSLFVLSAFLLTAAMSYAIGTSFGVTATAGVIVMSIARAGGVAVLPVAGAILSGVYVGDRGSPAASSANLVASLTGTDMRINIRQMLKTSWAPFLLAGVFYAVLSVFYPIRTADSGVLAELAEEFNLSWLCIVPAVLMIVLPFCRVKVKWAMACSIAVSVVLSASVQHASAADIIKAAVLGFEPENSGLSPILSGGGVISMLNVSGILLISGTYGGIFKGTGILSGLENKISALQGKTGRYPAMLLISALVCMVFCNQTIGCIIIDQLCACLYGNSEKEKYCKMLDMEDSVIVVAGLVPWCIACSVPLAMIGADARAIPAAVFLWLLPLWNYLFRNKRDRYAEHI